MVTNLFITHDMGQGVKLDIQYIFYPNCVWYLHKIDLFLEKMAIFSLNLLKFWSLVAMATHEKS